MRGSGLQEPESVCGLGGVVEVVTMLDELWGYGSSYPPSTLSERSSVPREAEGAGDLRQRSLRSRETCWGVDAVVRLDKLLGKILGTEMDSGVGVRRSMTQASCGAGLRSRFRQCSREESCRGDSMETLSCSGLPCEEAAWLSWGEWGPCSASCGFGERARARECPQFGLCEGSDSEILACSAGACDGSAWSPWSPWSLCSRQCGPGGGQGRARACPHSGDCPGSSVETRSCEVGACRRREGESSSALSIVLLGEGSDERAQTEGEERRIWSPWSRFTRCSADCGPGLRRRARACSKPRRCDGKPRQVLIPTFPESPGH